MNKAYRNLGNYYSFEKYHAFFYTQLDMESCDYTL